MKGGNQENRAHGTASGYALLLVMFFLALLVVSLAGASPTVINSIQRERETEMIWRGKQYARGIRLYYAKMKRLPGSLDDLTKPGTAGIRFMRQAYKDPMNNVDGSWRLIFIGPSGQLIGSNGVGGSGLGAPAFGLAQAGGSSSFPTSTGRGPLNTTNSNTTTPVVTTGGNMNEPSTDDPSQPQSLDGPMDAKNTIGGSIVGVGSKVNKESLIVYHGMQNYKHFEFIFDRSTVGSAAAGIGTALQNSTAANSGKAGTPGMPASNAGDWINQMLPGTGSAPQAPPLAAAP